MNDLSKKPDAMEMPLSVVQAEAEANAITDDPKISAREEKLKESLLVAEKIDDDNERYWSDATTLAMQTVEGAKRRLKECEDRRQELKGPSLKEGQDIDAAFKSVKERLFQLRKQAESLISMNSARQRRLQAEQARLAAVKEREELLKKQAEAERLAAEANDPDTIAAAEIDALTAEYDLKNAKTAADNTPPPSAEPVVIQTETGQAKATVSKVLDSVNITDWKVFLQWVVDNISDANRENTPVILKLNEVEMKKLIKILINVPGVNAIYSEKVTVRGTK